MNYKIIKDEKLLKDFIDWLPVLEPHEKFYCCLFSRSKYLKDEKGVNKLPHIKTDKSQLKRFVSDKERLFQKIKQLEIEVGWYKQREHIVPQEALALYISINPRDMWKATINTMVKLANCIRDQNTLGNPHQEALSEIHRTKSRTCFVDFDFDYPEDIGDPEVHTKNVKEQIFESVNEEAVTLVRTRGGLHCLVDPKKVTTEFKNKFYMKLSAISGVDQTGDMLIPVVGCTQGNFIPHFL